MIYNNVKRLNVTVHDSMRVCEIKCFQNFVGVQPNIHVVKGLWDDLGFYIWNVLKDKARRLWDWVSNHIIQLYNVWTAVKCLKDFCLAIDFLLSHGFENLNYTGLIVINVTALVNLRVLAPSKLLNDLVALKFCPVDVVLVIEGVKMGSLRANVFVRPHKLKVWFDHFLFNLNN